MGAQIYTVCDRIYDTNTFPRPRSIYMLVYLLLDTPHCLVQCFCVLNMTMVKGCARHSYAPYIRRRTFA